MTITGSGAISFSQINDEIGASSTATLSIETVAENVFGLTKPHAMDEFYGLTFATTWTNNTSSIALQIDTAKSGQLDTFVRPSTSSPAANIDVNNPQGNSSVSVSQASYLPGSGEIQIAVSVEGDPGSAGNANNGTGWDTSHSGIEHDFGNKIYYRIRHQDTANNTETDPVNQTETITFTNNSVNSTVSVPYRIQQV